MSRPPTPEPFTAQRLRTGAFSASPRDDHLFDLRVGGRAALERIYPTVRGSDWGLSRVTTTATVVAVEPNGFTMTSHSEHILDFGRVSCRLDVHGSEGIIDVQAVFTALTDVVVRRIGLCLIHPLSNTGRGLKCRSGDGSIIRTSFPRAIVPHALATNVIELTAQLGGTAALHVKAPVTGLDIEDHRNWGDPGWKSFLPPLASGGIVTMPAGSTITRRLQLSCTDGSRADPRPPREPQVGPAEISFTGRHRPRLPSLGTVTDATLTPAQLTQLLARKPHHLLFRWNPQSGPETLARASAEASALRAGLEVVLPTDSAASDDIARILAQTAQLMRVRLAGAGAVASAVSDAVSTLRGHLRRLQVAVPVGWSAASFTDLNRASIGGLDFAAYGLTPQTHHTDDRHIMQTPAVQRTVLHQARLATKTRDVSIGPITWNRPGADPDPRLDTQIAATWLTGLASYAAGANSLTCFTGQQLIEPGDTPVAAVFTLLSAYSKQVVRRGDSTDNFVRGIAFPAQLLIANLGPSARQVSVTDHGRFVGIWRMAPFSSCIIVREGRDTDA